MLLYMTTARAMTTNTPHRSRILFRMGQPAAGACSGVKGHQASALWGSKVTSPAGVCSLGVKGHQASALWERLLTHMRGSPVTLRSASVGTLRSGWAWGGWHRTGSGRNRGATTVPHGKTDSGHHGHHGHHKPKRTNKKKTQTKKERKPKTKKRKNDIKKDRAGLNQRLAD